MRKLLLLTVVAPLALVLSACNHNGDQPNLTIPQPPATPLQATGKCATVLDCAQVAVEAAQAAQAGADRAAAALPVGAIVPFLGTDVQAKAQRKTGWWVLNGDTVVDPASPLNGTKLPNLTGQFLYGASTAGAMGGSGTTTIAAQTITSLTTDGGGFGPGNVYGDPRTNVWSAMGWTHGAPIQVAGAFAATTVPILPPYYSVVYLVKVR